MQQRGIRRRLFNLFAALSQLIFVVTLASSISATMRILCSRAASVDLAWEVKGWGFHFNEDGWQFLWLTALDANPRAAWRTSLGDEYSELFGFRFTRGRIQLHSRGLTFIAVQSAFRVPYWFIFTTSALAPALWLCGALQTHRAHLRQQSGCCANCGYDLRASPERCPECGALPANAVG